MMNAMNDNDNAILNDNDNAILNDNDNAMIMVMQWWDWKKYKW